LAAESTSSDPRGSSTARDAAGKSTLHGIQSTRLTPRILFNLIPYDRRQCSGSRAPMFLTRAGRRLEHPCSTTNTPGHLFEQGAPTQGPGPPRKELRSFSISVLGCFPEVEGCIPSSELSGQSIPSLNLTPAAEMAPAAQLISQEESHLASITVVVGTVPTFPMTGMLGTSGAKLGFVGKRNCGEGRAFRRVLLLRRMLHRL
jgi:hypothetical protein